MFIGRQRELTALQNQYNSGKFEFTVIYGRRRVGKTAIINEFVKDIKLYSGWSKAKSVTTKK